MEPTDITIEILKGIRDEGRRTNERLNDLCEEVHELRVDLTGRIDGLRVDLTARIDGAERRQTQTEIRLATEIVGVATAVREVRDLLREDRTVRERVEDHEKRIVAIERRV